MTTSQHLTGPVQIKDARLRAVNDLSIPLARQSAGRHEYDGVVQDLSPDGVKAGLRALGLAESPPQGDSHDEAQLQCAIDVVQVRLGELELHRINPLWHILNLDLSCYDREYAPQADRREARDRHVRQWPDAVDAALVSLDQMPAPVAEAALPVARGLGAFLADGEVGARAALDRFVGHLEEAVERGDPRGAMGPGPLQRLLETSEACRVDLTELARRADGERDRLQELLLDSCRRIDAEASVELTVERLRADHPTPQSLLQTTRDLVGEVMAWTAESGLVPYLDGDCEVALMPESQRVAAAGMFGAAPAETDAPSMFYVTPPDPTWPAAEQDRWLASFFNRATLPVMTVHEVAPGHFAHFRAWRRAQGEVRRTVGSDGFDEGWAHYTEQLALEEGFHADDPAFAVGIALDGLRRVARLRSAVGMHSGELTVDQAAAIFSSDAYVTGPAAKAEARRGLYHPGYGCYTWGRLSVLDLREKARLAWGSDFSLPRFHRAMLDLGSPFLGLLDTAVERG